MRLICAALGAAAHTGTATQRPISDVSFSYETLVISGGSWAGEGGESWRVSKWVIQQGKMWSSYWVMQNMMEYSVNRLSCRRMTHGNEGWGNGDSISEKGWGNGWERCRKRWTGTRLCNKNYETCKRNAKLWEANDSWQKRGYWGRGSGGKGKNEELVGDDAKTWWDAL